MENVFNVKNIIIYRMKVNAYFQIKQNIVKIIILIINVKSVSKIFI